MVVNSQELLKILTEKIKSVKIPEDLVKLLTLAKSTGKLSSSVSFLPKLIEYRYIEWITGLPWYARTPDNLI
jgi:hypothetical protein